MAGVTSIQTANRKVSHPRRDGKWSPTPVRLKVVGGSCRAVTTRPRSSGRSVDGVRPAKASREFNAPLNAALLVAARQVLPLALSIAPSTRMLLRRRRNFFRDDLEVIVDGSLILLGR